VKIVSKFLKVFRTLGLVSAYGELYIFISIVMKRVVTILILTFLLTSSLTFLYAVMHPSNKKELEFSALYVQVLMFMGSEKEYYNHVTYPQATPELNYDDFFIEIVHQGQLSKPVWKTWGVGQLVSEEPLSDSFLQKIKNINISSDAPFGNLEPGEDLKEFFDIEKKLPMGKGEKLTAQQLIETKIEDFSAFLFTLKQAPLERSFHRFTITYELNDGKILSTTSRALNIKGHHPES
jgi:hypothetical protein